MMILSVQSIKDCIQLGKFRSRPRSLLIKLSYISDVDNILYNRSNIAEGIPVKPDMNCEERHRESLLLKERWNLMYSGIDKTH